MNYFVLSGRLTRDPHKIREDADTCFITLAIDKRSRNSKEKQTSYPSVMLIGAAAQFANKYLRKGRLVAVSGRVDTYEKEVDGQRQTVLSLIGFEIEALDSPKRNEGAKNGANDASNDVPDNHDDDSGDDDWDDIPF